ncbi:hypothetical protein BC941DRAFT_416071 [Chlamydoabsidia padenii]|nr:hypothetical protein BC941DRAFT_416071 [Chlamydoabsidia padenii]
MDTGRISLPSIDSMLNSRPIHLQAGNLLSSVDQHRSVLTTNQKLYDDHTPPMSPLLGNTLPSWSSSIWNRHSRSISLDDAKQPLLSTSQTMQSSSSTTSRYSPPRLVSSVQPSHQGSTYYRSLLPPKLYHQHQESSSKVTPNINDNHHYTQQQLTSIVHRNHHHRRTVSTSHVTTSPNYMDTTPNRKYHCPECTKSFSRPSSLRTHMYSHTGEKPFACPYTDCNRTFSVQSNMRRHIRVHY